MRRIHPTFELLIAATFALSACRQAAEPPPAPSADPSPAQPAAPAASTAATETWNLTPDSKLSFVATQAAGQLDGGFATFGGTIEMAGTDLKSAKIRIEVDAASVQTADAKLTESLKGADRFDVAKYPKITFESTGITETGAMQHAIVGNLDFHGVSKSLTIPVTAQVLESRLVAQAEFILLRSEWGLGAAAGGQFKDEVLVRLDIEAERAGAPAADAATEAAGAEPAKP